MNQKSAIEITYLLSDRLYFDNQYFLEKRIISTSLYHPYLKKVIRLEFHLGQLKREQKGIEQYRNNTTVRSSSLSLETSKQKYQAIKSGYSNIRYEITKDDLLTELEQCCPTPKEQPYYIYQKAFDENKELPIFYSTMSYGLLFQAFYKLSDEYMRNLAEFNNEIQLVISDLIENEVVPSKTLKLYKEFLNNSNLFYSDMTWNKKYLSMKYLDNFVNEFIDGYIFHNWAKSCVKSFCLDIFPHIALICGHCENVMRYRKDKKYCSFKIDGRDCKIKADRHKHYQKYNK
ncbi:MAG: hypothetical protein ACD_20C00124G0018 [uncultured bacterium]|nr:MAG: hypothetical protein ACD_20C00124G0018 [uncultured bacterium]